jgi:ADP-heptose:LPS heptosyltransferase
MKILLIHFKLLGDTIFLLPAIKAIKVRYPDAQIHLLIPQEFIDVFFGQEDINKIWAFPRVRGKINLKESLPIVFSLISQKFDISIDMVGNDRGAILSALIFSKNRYGPVGPKINLLKRISYTKIYGKSNLRLPWTQWYLDLSSHFFGSSSLYVPFSLFLSDSHKIAAKKILGKSNMIFHIGSSQEKKEWPLSSWYELYCLCKSRNLRPIFSSGISSREKSYLTKLIQMDSSIKVLPSIVNLSKFMAVLNASSLVVSSDTAPLHLAFGLKVKVIGLFGPRESKRTASGIYSNSEKIVARKCLCDGDLQKLNFCMNKKSCMGSISVISVFEKITNILNGSVPVK